MRRRRGDRGGGHGAVFGGRFFSGLCLDDASLRLRLAYVTANAVHHRVVPTIDALLSHPWSSLGEVLAAREARLAQPGATLSLLDDGTQSPERTLLALLESRAQVWAARPGDPEADFDPEVHALATAAGTVRLTRRVTDAVGAPQSLRSISVGVGVPAAEIHWEGVCERRELLRAGGWMPTRLAAAACELAGVDMRDLRAGCRRRDVSRVRSIVAHVARDELAWPTCEVAAALGVSPSAVIQLRAAGAAALAGFGVTAADLIRRSQGGNGGDRVQLRSCATQTR